MASPLFDPMPGVSLSSVTPSHHFSAGGTMGGTMGGGHGAGGGDPLLDNSNLCDILMLERALETEAHVSPAIIKTPVMWTPLI